MQAARADMPDVRDLFLRMSAAVDRMVPQVPGEVWFRADATVPSGPAPLPDVPVDVAGALRGGPLQALRELEAAMSLERDPDNGVWETLQLEVHGHSGKAWLVVVNAIGRQEHVTTWGAEASYAGPVADWNASRADSRDLGTSWDVARRERRVADMPYDGPCLIDRGANRAIDIVTAAGGETYSSCEGHPWGAFLAYLQGPRDVAETLRGLGWSVEPDGHGTVVRMPAALDVATRDAFWREACAALEARLGQARA